MKSPQFSLRDLFWLILVAALAVGWIIERAGKHVERQHLIEGFEAANDYLAQKDSAAAAAGYRFEYSKGKMVLVPLTTPSPNARSPYESLDAEP